MQKKLKFLINVEIEKDLAKLKDKNCKIHFKFVNKYKKINKKFKIKAKLNLEKKSKFFNFFINENDFNGFFDEVNYYFCELRKKMIKKSKEIVEGNEYNEGKFCCICLNSNIQLILDCLVFYS